MGNALVEIIVEGDHHIISVGIPVPATRSSDEFLYSLYFEARSFSNIGMESGKDPAVSRWFNVYNEWPPTPSGKGWLLDGSAGAPRSDAFRVVGLKKLNISSILGSFPDLVGVPPGYLATGVKPVTHFDVHHIEGEKVHILATNVINYTYKVEAKIPVKLLLGAFSLGAVGLVLSKIGRKG